MDIWLRQTIMLFSIGFSELETRTLVTSPGKDNIKELNFSQWSSKKLLYLITLSPSSPPQPSWVTTHPSASVIDLIAETTTCCWGKPKAVVLKGPSSRLSQVGRTGNEPTAPNTPGPGLAWGKKWAMRRQRNQGQQLSRVAAMPGCRKTKERQLTLKKLYEDVVSLSSELPDIHTRWALCFQTQDLISKLPYSFLCCLFFFQERIWYCRKKPQEMDFVFFLFNSTEVTRDTN